MQQTIRYHIQYSTRLVRHQITGKKTTGKKDCIRKKSSSNRTQENRLPFEMCILERFVVASSAISIKKRIEERRDITRRKILRCALPITSDFICSIRSADRFISFNGPLHCNISLSLVHQIYKRARTFNNWSVCSVLHFDAHLELYANTKPN